jgi:saccharopine dehydrogenase-like NADP-dependent oxidoreductase
MKRILVLGAGRSSSSLIKYFLDNAREWHWHVTVGDISPDNAREKIGSGGAGEAVHFDINDTGRAKSIIAAADIIISLLPPQLHPLVALRCIEFGKHLLTASYASPEMKALHREAHSKGLLFLNECGLDPGIDHLSAMQVIDRIRREGGIITGFESFTGGLIAPETDRSNPWRYKFTWNPRNVVTAGQGTAKYLYNGKDKLISYPQLFQRLTRVHVPGLGDYEGYANRDSLRYIETYGLENIKTMLRGTLRNEGFCSAWNILVQLGCCDESYRMEETDHMTHADFIDTFLPPSSGKNIEQKLCSHFHLSPDGPEMQRLKWSGFFDETPIGLRSGSPAKLLEVILNKKWKLNAEDKDQIVMWHRFSYQHGNEMKEIQASLIATGNDAVYTAMAKTVGLPLAISAKLFLQGQIKARGVVIPTTPEFYEPILRELGTLGIALNEVKIS